MQFIKRHITMLLLLVVLLLTVALAVYPVFVRQRGSRVDTCMTHVQILGTAMQAYAADYEGSLPNALTWAVDLQPYFQDVRLLHCPEDRRRGERSYEMLQRRGDRRLPASGADRLIVLYEIGKYGPEYRHTDGMYVGHGDGHAKWYARTSMTPEVILRGIAPAGER